jgi:hypothetical protein
MLAIVLQGFLAFGMTVILGWVCYLVYDDLTYDAKRAAAQLEKDEDILDAVWAVEPTCGTNESNYEVYVNLMTILDYTGKRVKGEDR